MTQVLEAGRELDALVAEKIMGWRGPIVWVDDDDGADPYLFAPECLMSHVDANDRDWDCLVPRYSTNIDDALDVWQRAKANGVDLVIDPTLPRPFAIVLAALSQRP